MWPIRDIWWEPAWSREWEVISLSSLRDSLFHIMIKTIQARWWASLFQTCLIYQSLRITDRKIYLFLLWSLLDHFWSSWLWMFRWRWYWQRLWHVWPSFHSGRTESCAEPFSITGKRLRESIHHFRIRLVESELWNPLPERTLRRLSLIRVTMLFLNPRRRITWQWRCSSQATISLKDLCTLQWSCRAVSLLLREPYRLRILQSMHFILMYLLHLLTCLLNLRSSFRRVLRDSRDSGRSWMLCLR